MVQSSFVAYLSFLVGILLSTNAIGEIFKCETPDGVEFSPQPCSENAERVVPRHGNGGIDIYEGEEKVGNSEAKAHDGPVKKTLSGQVRDNKELLHKHILKQKSPQRRCGEWIDKNGMAVKIPCND